MRLRQLARKLEVNPDKIIGLLADSGHSLTNEANGKLTAEQVVIVESHYGQTDELNEPIDEVVEEEITSPEEIVDQEGVQEEAIELEVPLGPPADVTSQVSEELIEEEVIEAPEVKTGRLFKAIEDEEVDPNIEVIKAPKIELEGLKVLGKIDLPEPKPKKEEPAKEEIQKEAKPRQQNRRRDNRGGRGRDRQGRKGSENPIEEERKRQERIAQRRKRDKEAAIKKRKEAHYRKQLKSKPVTPKPKKNKVDVEAPRTSAPVLYQSQSSEKSNSKSKPKSPLRRFWGWLNGEYDQF